MLDHDIQRGRFAIWLGSWSRVAKRNEREAELVQPLRRVLVLWADRRSANLGVRVLAEGSGTLLRSVLGDDIELTFQDFRGRETGVSMEKEGLLKDLGRPRGPIKQLIASHDLVWDTGAGDSYADIYGLGRLARMIRVQALANAAGVPVVMGPQTVGPFDCTAAAFAASRRMRRMSHIFARDPRSEQVARTLSARGNVSLSTDVVFALQRPVASVQRDVIFNVSGLLWKPNSHVDSALYQRSVRQLIGDLRQEGRQVSLLAHVLDNPSEDNDVPTAVEVATEFDAELLVPTDLDDARRLIASGQLLIGSRMHACLNAVSLGVPAIAWAYSRKFEPLFGELGWQAVVDLRSGADDIVGSTKSLLSSATPDAARSVRDKGDAMLEGTRAELRQAFS